MTTTVNAQKWRNPDERRRVLDVMRRAALESGRPSVIRVKDRWFKKTVAVIFPW